MKIRTPTSNEKMSWFIRTIDVASVLLAGPIAMVLRDPGLFSGIRFGATIGYCLVSFIAGLAMVIVFHLGQSVHHHISAREARAVVAASLASAALSAIAAFSFDRLNTIPRSLSLIQLLVLCSLMLGGRILVTTRHRSLGPFMHDTLMQTHVLLVNANDFALSYLRMLDAFNVDRSNIVAILDRNSKLLGRALLGHPIIGPPSTLARVVSEYKVHGVEITRVLICENRPSINNKIWRKIEEDCDLLRLELVFLNDVLGFNLGGTTKEKNRDIDSAVTSRGYRAIRRGFDLTLSLVIALMFSPIEVFIAIGLLIDIGWPIIFWQKRVGYRGRPFLIYKFRTLYAPYDRQGNFVEEHRRASRFGAFLRRSRTRRVAPALECH